MLVLAKSRIFVALTPSFPIHSLKQYRPLSCFVLYLLLPCCLLGQPGRAQNIVLLIGDGLALSQVTASMYWTGEEASAYRRFPVVGFHKSHAHNDLVTDSAAGATAFSCGIKTDNTVVGMGPDTLPCTTILESLDDKGWATGMVTTCSATHATPASFIAHQEIRALTEYIAEDYLCTKLDCFVGGGAEAFAPHGKWQHLRDSLEQRGYAVDNGVSFRKMPMDGSAPFFLFTATAEPSSATDGREYLPDAVESVLPFLKRRSDQGFFLVVEGSQIDWALHANNERWLRDELLDFDKTIQKVLDYAATDGNTLVLVTGDHECAGLAIGQGDTPREIKARFTERQHTAAMVPVFAYGPGAESFTGVYENTDLYWKMWAALGLMP
jgi:alkaline phosphatase